MSVERDVVERLERTGIGYYVTESEALAVWAEPRQTLDIDIVTDLAPGRYDAVIRPAFEDAYVVNDLIMRRTDAWGLAAFERRRQPDLDWAYIDRFAAVLGIGPLVERIRAGR